MPALQVALPQLTGLTSLSLSIFKSAQGCSGLMQAIFGLSQLQQLSLQSNYGCISQQDLANIPALQQLRSLSLTYHFDDGTLCMVQQLMLISCGRVSDTGLSSAVNFCKGLRKVHLELLLGVTVQGVAALAAGQYVSEVILEGCRNVSSEQCKEMMKASRKLELEIIKRK